MLRLIEYLFTRYLISGLLFANLANLENFKVSFECMGIILYSLSAPSDKFSPHVQVLGHLPLDYCIFEL